MRINKFVLLRISHRSILLVLLFFVLGVRPFVLPDQKVWFSTLYSRCTDDVVHKASTFQKTIVLHTLPITPQTSLCDKRIWNLRHERGVKQFTLLLHPSDSSVSSNGKRSQTTRKRPQKNAIHMLGEDSSSSACSSCSSMDTGWVRQGFFFSSFSDGIEFSPKAKLRLKTSLVLSFASYYKRRLEEWIHRSAVHSPCCGPTNIHLLSDIEKMESYLEKIVGQKSPDASRLSEENPRENDIQNLVQFLTQEQHGTPFMAPNSTENSTPTPTTFLRLIYIPTAMYATRSDSTNTPGKQKQRARADGKKRRDALVAFLQDLFHDQENISILAITLDLDDGSIKQPYGSNDKSMFPTHGHEAFVQWNPNLIYVEGGNTFYLYHCMEKGDWMKDFYHSCSCRNTSEQTPESPMVDTMPFAVYMGKSAGAIVAGCKVETACWKGWDDPSLIPGRSQAKDWAHVTGLKLAGQASFFVHMTPEWEPVVNSKIELWSETEKQNLYRLRDDQVCFVDGNHKTVELISAQE